MMQPEDEAGLAVGSTDCGRSTGCGAASVDKFAAGSSTGTFVHEKSLHVTACVHDMYMHIRPVVLHLLTNLQQALQQAPLCMKRVCM